MIAFDIVDNSQPEAWTVYITGHGIPGSGGASDVLNVLGAQGSFVQAALTISSAACSGTTATVTTSVRSQMTVGQAVFVSGVSEPGYNGVVTVTSVSPSALKFEYSVASKLDPGSGGAVYLPELISSQNITAASAKAGIVTLTLAGTANVPLNSPIFLSGLTGSGSAWNGAWSVMQNPASNAALGPDQVQIAITNASGDASLSEHASVQIVSLQAVKLSTLPVNPQTGCPTIFLNETIAGFSSQLVVLVTPAGETPFPPGLSNGTANLANLNVPPFAPGQQTGNSLVDIVEFYYAGSHGYSTFDVSEVDGFVLPLKLQASRVTAGPDQVGVNSRLPGFSRNAVGQAYSKFIQKEPVNVQETGQFGRLLYRAQVDAGPCNIAPASATGKPLQGVQLEAQARNTAVVLATAGDRHGLVPGQTIDVTDAGSPFDGTFNVQTTGLTDPSLTARQFTYSATSAPSTKSSGKVTATESGVIATGSANLVVSTTSGTAPASGATVTLSGVPAGSFASSPDAAYTVVAMPPEAGLPASAVFLASTTGQNFTVGNSSGGGLLGTPIFAAPPIISGEDFYAIAAPKDWLSNQSVGTANNDPLATWWDTNVDAFFAANHYLQVAIGAGTSYTGVCDATGSRFTFYEGLATRGTPAFHIDKPTAGSGQSASLANALWVWAQANIPATHAGTVWDQIVQAFCRGVALDGVLTSAPTQKDQIGSSNAAWTKTEKWYTEHTSTAFPHIMSRYCPFSKFLHYGTLDGTTDRTGASSIYLYNRAYGFSEDETPLGADGSAISTGVPPKMDGTLPDGITLTLFVGRPPEVVTASATTVMEGGVVLQVLLRNQGSGYYIPPTVTITPPGNGGRTAEVTATLEFGKVTGLDLTNQGSGYTFSPQVIFSLD